MKIIHIYDGHERVIPEESVPSVVYYLSKYFVKMGHEVTVLERRWKGLDYNEVIEGINFERINLRIGSSVPYEEIPYKMIESPLRLLRFIFDRIEFALKVYKYLSKNDFDIIHAHLPFAANILMHLNRRLRRKTIFTAHIGEEKKRFNLNSKETPLAIRFFSPDLHLIKRVRKSVILNESLKEKLVLKGIKIKKLEVIQNGVEVKNPNFSDEEIKKIKEKYEIKENIIMFAGTITPRKGVEYLVKAASILEDENDDFNFIIVGNTSLDKEYVKRIQEYIERHDLSVKLTGFIPYEDLMKLYLACDIFVLPSLEEGFGMVLTEALASGKTLIGTKVGGIPTQIRDGWNGFIIEPANEKQLAEKIGYLIDNEEERIRMGKNSRKLAEEEFDWKKIAEGYLEVYEAVVG